MCGTSSIASPPRWPSWLKPRRRRHTDLGLSGSAPGHQAFPMSPAPEFAVFPKDRVAIASDTTPIAYTIRGDGDLVPIVFLNGWTCSDGYWAGVVPALVAAGHPAVLLDTRGHGQSGLPRAPGFLARNLTADDVSVDRLARDVVAVLDDAGIEQAAVAGHSMGVQTLFE